MMMMMFDLCSLCKYLMVASGRASVYILGAKAEKSIKVSNNIFVLD